MATLCYVLTGRDPRQHQELSYSILSALKQGLEGVEILLVCDAENRRADLPVGHLDISTDQMERWTEAGRYPAHTRLHALQMVLEKTDGPVCLVETDTAFKAAPRELFNRITPKTPLLHDRAGWLSSRPEWGPLIDACRDTPEETLVQAGAEVFDTATIGLLPAHADCIKKIISLSKSLPNTATAHEKEQFLLGAALLSHTGNLSFSDDIVTHYAGYMRHVYHGRFDVMFPAGAAVNTALAHQLPTVAEPPKPLLLQLKAKYYALRHGLGRGTQFGYLAYLCAFAAPTAEGRNVWANIALDMMERSERPAAKLQRDLPKLAPDALIQAELAPATEVRWRDFWASKDL